MKDSEKFREARPDQISKGSPFQPTLDQHWEALNQNNQEKARKLRSQVEYDLKNAKGATKTVLEMIERIRVRLIQKKK